MSLAVSAEPGENWIWVGLKFDGKAGLALYPSALGSADDLKAGLVGTVESEEYENENWLGIYRLALLKHREWWPEYVRWVHAAVDHCRRFYENRLVQVEPECARIGEGSDDPITTEI